MRVVVSGLIATYPFGGIAWHYLQYLLGFQKLGCDVFYIEDTGRYTYDSRHHTYSADHRNNINYLRDLMHTHGLDDCWAFRGIDGEFAGAAEKVVLDRFKRADLFLNVSGSCWFRPEYQQCKRSAYLDTDPGYNQIKVARFEAGDADDDLAYSVSRMADHDFHFTFAENINQPDCGIPANRFHWKPTRQPIVMDQWWPNAGLKRNLLTTVMSWRPYEKPMIFDNQTYFGKEHRLERVIELPNQSVLPLELAISGEAPIDRLKSKGWLIRDAGEISKSAGDYRQYIWDSMGEFSVAKDIYVSTLSGWFSERSACYLAAGRPVILEDTGFSRFFPTGEGLHAFHDQPEALAAVERVVARYEEECNAAREIARSHFRAEHVLTMLLAQVSL